MSFERVVGRPRALTAETESQAKRKKSNQNALCLQTRRHAQIPLSQAMQGSSLPRVWCEAKRRTKLGARRGLHGLTEWE